MFKRLREWFRRPKKVPAVAVLDLIDRRTPVYEEDKERKSLRALVLSIP